MERVEGLLEVAIKYGNLLPSQAGDMTPAEIEVIVRAQLEERAHLQDAANWRMGVLCSLIANLNRDKSKKAEPFKPSDFFYFSGELKSIQQRRMTDEEMLGVVKQLNTQMGGEVT